MTTRWPAQADCDSFYGNPRGSGGVSSSWESANLVEYIPPWRMIDEDSRKVISGITIHRKCRDSLARVFEAAWAKYGKSQAEIEKRHLHIFSGSFNYRNIRGSTALSMHAYGIALDIASSLNELGAPYNPLKGLPMDFVQLFEAEGWTWGGRWHGRPDAMHFQAAYVSRSDIPKDLPPGVGTGTVPTIPIPPVLLPSNRPELSLGSTGDDVRWVQQKLMVDGIFGHSTEKAVRAFQSINDLRVDGIVGTETWNVLQPPPLVLAPTPAPTPGTAGVWHSEVITTVFGGAADRQRSAYDNKLLNDTDLYASLPWRFSGAVPTIDIQYKGKTLIGVPIRDEGPWLTDDDYFIRDTRPLAETCFLTRTPLSRGPNRGRVPNGAGLDISPGAARALGLSGKDKVNWRFSSHA